MDRRIYLHALAELGFGDAHIDWRTAPHTLVVPAWEKLWQEPLLVNVSAAGRLASALYGGTGVRGETSRSTPAPRYRLEQIAYWFFDQLGQDARDRLGVVLVDANDLTSWCFAQLRFSIDEANAAAKLSEIPLLFEEKLSEAEKAWKQQVRAGKVVGMDDPVWMAKAQEQINAHLEWLCDLKKGERS